MDDGAVTREIELGERVSAPATEAQSDVSYGTPEPIAASRQWI